MRLSKWKNGDRVHFEIEAEGHGDGRIVKVKEVHDRDAHYWLHVVRVASGTRLGTDSGGWSPASDRYRRPRDDRPYKKGAQVHALDFELTRARRTGR